MMKSQLTHILNVLKKWLSRLARRSASLFFAILSFLHRFASGHLKLGDRKLITRFPSRALLRSQGDIEGEDVPICSSLLPPGLMGLEAVGEPPSPSDDPYTGTHPRHLRPLRKGTANPPLEANPTSTEYPSTTETDGLHQGSMSSSHLSPQMDESSVNNRTFLENPLQESSSPGPSRLSGLHEVSRTQSQPRGFMDDTHSVNTTRTPSMGYLAPDMPYSQHASSSRISLNSGRSLTRSIARSESRQAAYRTHKGPVHSRPVSVHNFVADMRHGSPNRVSVPLDLPSQAVPALDTGIDCHVHYTAPPGSDEQPGSEVVMVYDGPPTSAMVARDVRRYERCTPRATNASKTTVPAMTITFRPHEPTVPPGWVTFVHPEGARYFMNQRTRTFTEMNICDEEICEDIEYYMQYLLDELQQVIEQKNLDLDLQQVDLVVEPKVFDDNSVVCCYYFANHRERCLFWLDDFHAKDILSECKGVETLSHIRLAIQAQYWRHWDYFPSLCPVTQDIVDELKNTLAHVACDHLTSKQSSAAFDTIELRDHLSVVSTIKVHSPADRSAQQCHAAIIIGRLMYLFNHNQFVNYHGEDCVRLMHEQTVHNWAYKPSPWMVVLAPLLFFYPVTQIQELHKIFPDEVVCTAQWNVFSTKFKGQLQDSNLLATVLLNANVGFLAINTVDKGGRDAIQMASYMSLVTSLGSIVLGLFFVSHDRTSGQNIAKEVADFLSSIHDEKRGLENLAIIYSLPKALLMWGMMFFFAAFSIDWWTAGDITSRAIVGTVTLVAFTMISSSIWRTGEGDLWLWWLTVLHRAVGLQWSYLAGAWKQVMKFTGMKKHQVDLNHDPHSYPEEIGLAFACPPQADAEANAPMRITYPSTISPGFQPEIPNTDDSDNYPNSSIPSVLPYHSIAPVDSPPQPHDVNSVLPSSESRTSLGFLSGVGSLQQIQEDIPTVFRDESATEAREPDGASLGVHFTTSPSPASEGIVGMVVDAILHSDTTILSEHELQTAVVATDTGAPSSFCTEEGDGLKYTETVVEEPGELDHPQRSSSTTPPPRIFARSATDDYFHHAPVAPKWTLRDGHDIEECQD